MMDTETLLMKFALEDIEKYAKDLKLAADTMKNLSDMLLDTPDADEAQRTAEGFSQAYNLIATELLRQTSRGLGRV